MFYQPITQASTWQYGITVPLWIERLWIQPLYLPLATMPLSAYWNWNFAMVRSTGISLSLLPSIGTF
jgi:hypothetical protein